MRVAISETDPFIHKIDQDRCLLLNPPELNGRLALRLAGRSLQGMQKEAIIRYGHNGTLWRIVCDEGPWLNGTDLAPFPLGFFNAGLVASYLSEYNYHAKQRGIALDALEVMVDTRYCMEGSLLQGTMRASALPVHVTFNVQSDANDTLLKELAWLAVASSPVDAYLREAHSSLFELVVNGQLESSMNAGPALSGGLNEHDLD